MWASSRCAWAPGSRTRPSARRWSRPPRKRWLRSAAGSTARSPRPRPISCRSASNAAIVMREPAFWRRKPGLAARQLAPLSLAYGAVAGLRLRQRGRRAGMPVVCIGNFTVGGAGKTPTALAVARMLATAGERPVFLSRGYGGRLAGPVLLGPARHAADDRGDE